MKPLSDPSGPPSASPLERILPVMVFLLGLCIAAAVGWAWPVEDDELEFARAAAWISEGRWPYLDFWEHHPPLLWIVLAPVAWITEVGADFVGLLRFAQAPLVLATAAAVALLSGARGPGLAVSGIALCSVSVVAWSVQVRVDTPMNLCLLAGLLLCERAVRARGESWRGFAAAGFVLGLGCLASQRLVPLAVVATLLYALSGRDEGWSFDPRALGMPLGATLAAMLIVVPYAARGGLPELLEQLVGVNARYVEEAARSASQPSLLDWLGRYPFGIGDWSLVLLGVAALVLLGLARRHLLRPGPLPRLALMAGAGLLFLTAFEQVYPYHLPSTWWLLAATAGRALHTLERPPLTTALAGVGLLVAIPSASGVDWPALSARQALHEQVSTRARDLTEPGARVFDGSSRLLDREPACELWFLPHLVRLLTSTADLPPCVLSEQPPAAIIMDHRAAEYLRHRTPAQGAWVLRHYLPVDRHVWIPAPNGPVGAGMVGSWTAPATGKVRVRAVAALLDHPWLSTPWEQLELRGEAAEEWRVDLEGAALVPADIRVDGVPPEIGADGQLHLEAGQVVQVRPVSAAFVFVLPVGITEIFAAPLPSSGLETLW